MSKAKRFWLSMACGLLVMIPVYFFIEANAPLLHKAITLLAEGVMFYGFSRWLYEHWDDR